MNTTKNQQFQGLFLGDDDVHTPPVIENTDDLSKLEDSQEPKTPEQEIADSIPREEEQDIQSPAEEVEFETSFKVNPISIIAKDWKEQGRIPEDFEVKEDLTPEEFEEAYRTHLLKNTESELKSEAIKALKEEYGIDDDFLEEQKKLRSGVDPEDVETMDLYFRLSSIQLDPEDNNYKEYVKDLFRYYYTDKEFSKEEVERFASRDLEEIDEDDIPGRINQIQTYFSQRGKQKKSTIDAVENNIRQAKIEKINKFSQDVKEKLDSLVINNKKYSKEQMALVKKAFFDKTEVIVNDRGERERVTLFEKKSREHKTNFELYMDHLVNFILGTNAVSQNPNPATEVRKTLRQLNDAVDIRVKGKAPVNEDRGIISTEIN